MTVTVDRFAQIVGGEPVGFPPGAALSGFATDNRQVKPRDLFLAIKGERVDGHDFALDAVSRGAVGSLVEHSVAGPHILVPNLVDSLAKLGRHFRAQFDGPVVGVTGSAGKTTAKEFIAAALSPLGPVLKTEGNKNTEYTAPLMWSELVAQASSKSKSGSECEMEGSATQAVVVEMAMRGFDQIRHLAKISQPTMAVITNIGYSHMSEVGSRDGIAQAKAELLECLPNGAISVLWQEDDYLSYLKSKAPGPVVTFGYCEDADCWITAYHALSWTSSRIEGYFRGEHFDAELPTVGRHIALGALVALAVAVTLGVPVNEAARTLSSAQLPPMRMEVREFHGAKILLDTYNAAPPSMRAAIETFAELPCGGRRLAVIGEMRELGPISEPAHRELGRLLAASGIDEVMFYSGDTVLSAEEARMRGLVVHQAGSLNDVSEFLRKVHPGDTVLVKGSRSLELETALSLGVHP